ncbi:mammalian cell entry protein [[Mycobacterium] nativiensis]|uniref:Mammalian cell entry protein n=1 Tax=[Mycobacterium] nativiensis TaxID=2855503 RepID=A0ABU5Y243_9MYCO|nr:mammalian cell entry protein [Mycolicibacter sp. MYC340]MEB3032945.1 mammalian cell entry protein [Mycolicibacter sp. MYC340]
MAINDDAPERQLNAVPESGSHDEPGCPAEDSTPNPTKEASPFRAAMLVGLASVVAFAGLGGWLGIRAYQSHQAELQRALLLQVARQGAVNLTTIDYEQAESDVQRVLDSATGNFYDDFSRRSQPFIEVVKAAQAKSVGTVTEAGIEHDAADETNVLVGVTVKTTNASGADQVPRSWRMRISLTQVDAQPKISNVAFVP